MSVSHDARWVLRCDAFVAFLLREGRAPSKYVLEEHGLRNWLKKQRRVYDAGRMPSHRVARFERLLGLVDALRRRNQYAYWSEERARGVIGEGTLHLPYVKGGSG